MNWEGTELCAVYWVSSCDIIQSVKRVRSLNLRSATNIPCCWLVCINSDTQRFVLSIVYTAIHLTTFYVLHLEHLDIFYVYNDYKSNLLIICNNKLDFYILLTLLNL
jgi:hypothetical protein